LNCIDLDVPSKDSLLNYVFYNPTKFLIVIALHQIGSNCFALVNLEAKRSRFLFCIFVPGTITCNGLAPAHRTSFYITAWNVELPSYNGAIVASEPIISVRGPGLIAK
jgi:hypothetical protein